MNQSLVLLITQLVQLAMVEVPNIAKIVATLRDGTSMMEAFLTEADTIELAEIEKLKAQLPSA